MSDLDFWMEQNALPEELEDVLYEEDIKNINQLANCSPQKMSNIIKALEQNMGPSLTSQKKQHIIQCLENTQLDQIKHQSSQENKILNKIKTYDDAYTQSLEWIKHKQKNMAKDTHQFNNNLKTMFTSIRNKTENIIEKRLIKYEQTLNDSLSKQKEILNKIKMAKRVYIQDQEKKQNDPKAMTQFNNDIANRLQKYNPTQCINNNNIFDTLKQNKEKLEIKINQQIVDLLLQNCSTDNEYESKNEEILQLCSKCNAVVTQVDFQFNVTNYNNKFQHIDCHESLDRLYIECYVSSISQYSLNSTGSCTINALESAIQLQMNRKPSIELVNEIVNLAALYKQNKHTSVSDIFPVVTRYKNNLDQVDWMQITVNNITNIIDAMEKVLKNVSSTTDCVSGILTKPPETIFMHLTNENMIYIYDSHPRTKLNGSHFLVFDERKNVELYLKELWPFQYLGAGFNDLRSQQINMLDVYLFQLKSDVTPAKDPNIELMSNELLKVGVTLENKWQKNYGTVKSQNYEPVKKKWNDNNKELETAKNEIVALNTHIEQLKKQIGILQSEAMIRSQQSLNSPTTVERARSDDVNRYNCSKVNNIIETKENNVSERKEDISVAFNCKLCKCTLPTASVFIYSKCNCKTCRHCAQKYFKQQFENGKWPILCPWCGQDVNENDFKLCSGEICELYNEQLKIVLNGFNEIQCPWCNKVRMLKNWKTTQKSVCCTQNGCDWAACRKCYVGWNGKDGQTGHNGLNCDEVKKIIQKPKYFRKCKCKKMVKNESDKYGNKYNNVSQCGNCKKMTCFECGESFAKMRKKHKCLKDATLWDTLWSFIN